MSDNIRSRIYGFEARIARITASGIVDGLYRLPILRAMKAELNRFRRTVSLTDDEVAGLWRWCMEEYASVSRSVWGRRSDMCAVYRAIRATIPDMEKAKNAIGRSIEERDKRDYVRRLTSRGIFYLCSKHSGCARGHEAYQGKVYVSADWEKRCRNADERERVRACIRNRRIRTVQSAVDGEPWLVSRPYCRHYFVRLTVEETLGASARSLLRKHGAEHGQAPDAYAYSMYRGYLDRLRTLLELKKALDCPELVRDISKTRRLMRKWRALM